MADSKSGFPIQQLLATIMVVSIVFALCFVTSRVGKHTTQTTSSTAVVEQTLKDCSKYVANEYIFTDVIFLSKSSSTFIPTPKSYMVMKYTATMQIVNDIDKAKVTATKAGIVVTLYHCYPTAPQYSSKDIVVMDEDEHPVLTGSISTQEMLTEVGNSSTKQQTEAMKYIDKADKRTEDMLSNLMKAAGVPMVTFIFVDPPQSEVK